MKQQRLEAELLNMTLRRTLAKEQKVAKSLRTIMDKRPFMPRSVKYDMRRASCSQTETRTQISQCTQCCNPTTSHINPTGVRREIEATLQRMHVQTNALLNATAADDSLSFNFNIRLDPAAGPTIEVTTTTPMNCTLDHTVKLLGPKYQGQVPIDLYGPRCVPPRRHDIKNYQHDEILGTPSESTYASATTARTETADSESVSLKTREHSSSRPRRKRIRKVGSVPYSTDLQRRRKAEVLSLRSEVQELECKLSQLQQQSNGGETAISTRQSQAEWQNRAWIVRQEREKAESANRELKNILSKRFSFIASMQTLLQRSDLLEGIDILSQNSMQLLTQPGTANSILAEMSGSLEQMLLRVDSVFPALDSCLAVALITHKKRHEVCGTLGDNCVETISVTPMPCTVAKSGMLLWQQLVNRKDTEPDKLYRFIRASHDSALEMSFTLPLSDQTKRLWCVDAVSSYRKYEEDNRVVLVGKTTWRLRAGGLEFETLHWTVISPLPTESPQLQASVVQSCNRLQVKHLDLTSLQATHGRHMLLTSIGSRLRSFMKTMQTSLLQHATGRYN
ncbi:hypothetical protein PC129_g7515 [Phytophthora cactorum]|uniref:Uncharacterized protein n=1 Tax=Phytophthora cactorum TaxID=29920 RepID=A0A8T1IA73_9STRA|nr:hypothetical protein PC129_g7515 [Phytophthora cactorum]